MKTICPVDWVFERCLEMWTSQNRKYKIGWIGSFAKNIVEKYNHICITDNGKWYIGPGGPICYETEV